MRGIGVLEGDSPCAQLCALDALIVDLSPANCHFEICVWIGRNIVAAAHEENICDTECTSDGCWGPHDNQCIDCKHYRFGKRCVSNCSHFDGLFTINSSKECGQCHEECELTTNACTGPVSDHLIPHKDTCHVQIENWIEVSQTLQQWILQLKFDTPPSKLCSSKRLSYNRLMFQFIYFNLQNAKMSTNNILKLGGNTSWLGYCSFFNSVEKA